MNIRLFDVFTSIVLGFFSGILLSGNGVHI